MNKEQLEEVIWHFYESVQDTNSQSTAKICADLVINHEFPMKTLPDTLYNNVYKILLDRDERYLLQTLTHNDLSRIDAHAYC
jgi:hypothetical protein